MKSISIATATYALFVFIGGVIGFATAHSLPSIIMGTIFSILLGVCAWGMYKDRAYSKISAIVLTAILLVVFAIRLQSTLAFFPAGIMTILSLALLTYLWFSKKPKALES